MIAPSTLMEVPMINWPTAFVIAVAMVCGAVLINKPSDAAFGSDGGSRFGAPGATWVWQSSGAKIRWCRTKKDQGIACSPYK